MFIISLGYTYFFVEAIEDVPPADVVPLFVHHHPALLVDHRLEIMLQPRVIQLNPILLRILPHFPWLHMWLEASISLLLLFEFMGVSLLL